MGIISAMTTPPSFAPIATALRDEVIEHYERIGARLDTPSGLRTLDTNSSLAADRGRIMLRLLAEAGAGSIAGKRLLDVGAGFGSLAVYFAHLGADVVAVDPHADRMLVGTEVARRFGLSVRSMTAFAEDLPLSESTFDFAIVNNVLCYLVDRSQRRAALAELMRVLLPGGWLVLRNPNRLTPLDPFTGLPLLAMLPPRAARLAARAVKRHRSDVRLNSPFSAVHELRRAGFVEVQWRPIAGGRSRSRLARYHHVVARAPSSEPRGG